MTEHFIRNAFSEKVRNGVLESLMGRFLFFFFFC